MQPPHQPPQQPPHQPPIPPPDAPIGGTMYIPQHGPAQVNFDVISRAWEALKPNMGIWVGAFLIYLVISLVISTVVGMMGGGGGTPIPGPDGRPNIVTPNFPVMILGNLVQLVIGQFLIGGLYRMGINQVRTGTANLGDMFSVADVLPALIGAAILSGLAMFVGFLLCFIPGLLLAGLLLFAIPLVVDKRAGAVDALTTSINTLKPQMGMAVLFAFVIGLLMFSGALLCGVGMLITGPLAILSVAMLYNDFFPRNTLA